jgi:hypothetical protein
LASRAWVLSRTRNGPASPNISPEFTSCNACAHITAWQSEFGSASAPPAIFVSTTQGKTAGETPALRTCTPPRPVFLWRLLHPVFFGTQRALLPAMRIARQNFLFLK